MGIHIDEDQRTFWTSAGTLVRRLRDGDDSGARRNDGCLPGPQHIAEPGCSRVASVVSASLSGAIT